MKKVIITGAGGFIGGALTRKLLDDGAVVYGIDISEENLKKFYSFEKFVPVIADFSRYDELPCLINDQGFDVFYHFAWQGGMGGIAFRNYDLQLNNAINSVKAMEIAAKLQAKKFVIAGTSNELETLNIIMNPEVKPRTTCIYSSSKLAAEMICKTLSWQLGIEYCSGLIAMVYGPGNKSRTVTNMVIDSLNKGIRPKLIEGNNLYDFIYIDDVVNAFIAIGEYGKNRKSYYVGHRKQKKFKEWIIEMGEVLSPETTLIFGEYPDEDALIDYNKINLHELYEDTGFECSSDFKESILKTAEWLKNVNF